MTRADSAIDTLNQAAEFNLSDPFRKGSLLCFSNYGQVVMTGDMHGHRRNFDKLVRYCALEMTPVRHVILHELIHETPTEYGQPDLSFELMLDAAQWKTFFPDQVHFLQSNHELAQLHKHEITKGGRLVTDDFEAGVAEVLGSSRIDKVLDAIDRFIASFPLAGRTGNRIFLAHSLPDARYMHEFEPRCVDAGPDQLELSESSSAYRMVWGRNHTGPLLEKLSAAYEADFFIIGHQPQESGFAVRLERLVILASDHNHGVFLPIDCSKSYDIDTLVERIRPYAGVP